MSPASSAGGMLSATSMKPIGRSLTSISHSDDRAVLVMPSHQLT